MSGGSGAQHGHTRYDNYGNRILTTDARGHQTKFDFGTFCGSAYMYPATVWRAFGQPEARSTTYDYDCRSGLPVSVQDVQNNVTTITTYDVFGRPTLVREAAGTALERQTATHHWDFGRRVITRSSRASAADGILVSVERYDQLGRLRLRQQIENKDSECPTNQVPPEVPTEACPATGGIKVQTRYRSIRSADGKNYALVSNPYRATSEDTMGWTLTTRDQGGRVMEVRSYNGAAVPAPFADPGNSDSSGAVTTQYHRFSARTSDQAFKTRCSETDGLGRMTRVVENPGSFGAAPECVATASSYVTQYEFDAHDNLTTVLQGAQQRTFGYDSLSRLTSASNPEFGTDLAQFAVSYAYDNNGNLTQRTDPRGVVTTWAAYDGQNRPAQRSYSDGTPAVTYCYDGRSGNPCAGTRAAPNYGRLTWVGAGDSSTSYSYDLLGRATQSTQTTGGQSYASSYAYNLAGSLTSLTYPTNNRVVTMAYDAAGRLNELTDNTNPAAPRLYASSLSYAPHGALSAGLLGNNRWEHTLFNRRLQPTEIGLGTSSSDSSLFRIAYTYSTVGNSGNLQTQTISVPGLVNTQSYSYDAFNRLDGASETGGGLWYQNFGYDRYGNQWVKATNLPLTDLTPRGKPDNPEESDWFTLKNRIVGLGYDTTGNQTAAGGGTFTFDAESRMKSARVNALPATTSTFTYSYDGEGRRVKKTLYGRTTVYVYGAQGQLLAEYKDSSLHKQFIHAGSRLLAVESTNPAGTNFLTADHLGSTRVVTDASGAVKSCHDYQPFGKEIPKEFGGRAAIGCYGAEQRVLQRFTGKEVDPETGLEYFGARYFSGRQGRFTSVDPFNPVLEFQTDGDDDEEQESAQQQFNDYISDPQNWHRYAYVRNNPLKLVDETGEIPVVAYIVGMGILRAASTPRGQMAIQTMTQHLQRYGVQAGRAMNGLFTSIPPIMRGIQMHAQMGAPSALAHAKTIDIFFNRAATSLKTVDLFLKTYATNPSAVVNRLTPAIDRLSQYTSRDLRAAGVVRGGAQITRRILVVVIPKGSAERYRASIDQLLRYARTRRVDLIVEEAN